MNEAKINQLEVEADTWKRILNFFRDENIFMKNRLSGILKNGFDRNLLEEFENFQTGFIKHDEVISLLKNEIVEFEKLLLNERLHHGISDEIIDKKIGHLRNNMINSEREFCQLQLRFNVYISENMR
jgi:hypothetical protein